MRNFNSSTKQIGFVCHTKKIDSVFACTPTAECHAECARAAAPDHEISHPLYVLIWFSLGIVEPLDSCSPDLYVGHRASTASAAPKYTKGYWSWEA